MEYWCHCSCTHGLQFWIIATVIFDWIEHFGFFQFYWVSEGLILCRSSFPGCSTVETAGHCCRWAGRPPHWQSGPVKCLSQQRRYTTLRGGMNREFLVYYRGIPNNIGWNNGRQTWSCCPAMTSPPKLESSASICLSPWKPANIKPNIFSLKWLSGIKSFPPSWLLCTSAGRASTAQHSCQSREWTSQKECLRH